MQTVDFVIYTVTDKIFLFFLTKLENTGIIKLLVSCIYCNKVL